ncbi:MAG: hypothetical protein Q8P61_01560 [Candidatus Nanopelagicales bacterium]|nr:hypothetical protein [Candidatus Nanopelagicales bacterium]
MSAFQLELEPEHGIGPRPATVLDDIASRPLPDWPLILIVIGISLISTGVTQAAVQGGGWPRVVGDTGAASLATAGALWLWQLGERRWFSSRQARRWLDIPGFGVAAIVGSEAGIFMTGSQSAAAVVPWWARMLASTVVTTPTLLLISWLLARMARARTTVDEFESRRESELRNQDRLSVARERAAAQIRHIVGQAARPALEDGLELISELRRGPGPPDPGALTEAAERIRAHAEMEIRPLSHELGDVDHAIPGLDITSRHQNAHLLLQPRVATGWAGWLSSAFRLASRISPFQPVPVVVTMSLLLAPTVAWFMPPPDILPTLLLSMLGIGVVTTLGRLARRWIARAPEAARVIIVTGGYLLAGLVAHVLVVLVYGKVTAATDWVWLLVDLLALPLVGWVWALVAASGHQADVAARRLKAAAVMVRWQSARLDQILIDLRQRSSDLTHGQVQGRFIAAAMALMSAARTAGDDGLVDRDRAEAALQLAEDCLLEARRDVESLATDRQVITLTIADLLDSIAAAWRGIVDVRLDVPPSAADAIDQLPGLGEIVGAVVREAIANAARHGAASRVDIKIRWSDHPVITAEDNGTGPSGPCVPGLGLSAVSRAGGTWRLSRASRSRGALLAVDLPVPAELDALFGAS